MSSAPQTIKLEGAPNFRDLGGYRTMDGRTVRYGRVYRSQAFLEVTKRDLQTVGSLGIRLVCDLRSSLERRHAPNRWPVGDTPTMLHLDVSADARAGHAEFLAAIKADRSAHGVRQGMLRNYRNMPRAFGAVLPSLFERLLDREHLPAVIHCHAGKDRTGFLCAMILLALGVPRETVYEDYLRTAEFTDITRLARKTSRMFTMITRMWLSSDAVLPIVVVDAAYLDAALDQVDAEYGGVDAYLETAAGLDTARRQHLRDILLSDAGPS